MTMGDNLRRLREAKGLTQEHVARQTGLSDMMISYLERDKRGLTDAVAAKLAAVYGCTVGEITGVS